MQEWWLDAALASVGYRVEKDDVNEGGHDWLGNDCQGLVSLAWLFSQVEKGIKTSDLQTEGQLVLPLPPASHLPS